MVVHSQFTPQSQGFWFQCGTIYCGQLSLSLQSFLYTSLLRIKVGLHFCFVYLFCLIWYLIGVPVLKLWTTPVFGKYWHNPETLLKLKDVGKLARLPWFPSNKNKKKVINQNNLLPCPQYSVIQYKKQIRWEKESKQSPKVNWI